ncbi:MAG: hypothetical protein QXO40_00310 [Candidatus Aenigmatarchaeota archaeon]
MKIKTKFKIEKYKNGKLYEVKEYEDNIILNEGANGLWHLFIGDGTIMPFDNANAYLGVGDGNTPASSGQTGLMGTNTFYKNVDAGYPQISDRTITYKATFTDTEANFHWYEWTLANGNSNLAVNFNRKVEDMGEKVAGTTWVLTAEFSIL